MMTFQRHALMEGTTWSWYVIGIKLNNVTFLKITSSAFLKVLCNEDSAPQQQHQEQQQQQQ